MSIFLFLLFVELLITGIDGSTFKCEPLHVKSHGLDLICCSALAPLPSTCEYASYCRFEECSCHLTVREDLSCRLNLTANDPFEWKDHSVNPLELPCNQPNLPNPHVPYQVNVLTFVPVKTAAFLGSLCEVNVTFLSMRDYSNEMRYVDVNRCLKRLEAIEISLGYRMRVDVNSFKNLAKLKSFTLINVDFDFWYTLSPWTRTISLIHVENSTMSELPKWIASANQLTRLVMSHTRLHSISTVTQMKSLRSAKLSHNAINDLYKNVLSNQHLYDLDLSYNKIATFASYTFAQCSELRILDLSFNPIEHLPYKPFIKNTKLKWLKLDGTSIRTLTPENFAGLTSLKTLSLSNCPLLTIAPYAFLPLRSLKMLNLQACNLTRIPTAITQNCGLTHLNVADNLFHRRSSLPAEVLALLSSLTQLRIDGNPLSEFPPSIFLLSPDNTRLYRSIIQTMTALPVWMKDPCTPYYFHMHIANKSSSFRQLLYNWGPKQMEDNKMDYCREQYEWMIDQMAIYRDLENNSGCSVSRRLRSAFLSKPAVNCTDTEELKLIKCNSTNSTYFYQSPLLLTISLTANFTLFCFIVVIVCVVITRTKEKHV